MPHFASFDDTKIHYEDEGDGFPLVLLHGIIANIELNWRLPRIWQTLVEAGHRTIGVDARGHGDSDKPHDSAAYSDDAMAKDVAALFDHLGLAEADVVGYSMGAFTAMRFARAFDGPVEDVEPELLPFRLFADTSGMDMDALRALVRSDAFRQELDPAKLTVPALVLCGDADPMQPHELAHAIRDGRAEVVSGDHLTAVFDPGFVRAIVDFLK